MAPALSNATQTAIIATAFLVPVLTYLYYTKSQSQKSSAGPLPGSTEIEALYIHPIKSCHGISVQSAKLLPTGLDLDRQWMWVTYPNHEFLTIRNFAKMTLIRPSYDASTDTLTITAPAPDSIDEKLEFSIPAHPSKEWLDANTSTHDAKIWSTWTPARVYSTELTGPFNAFFGKEVRLVYKASQFDTPRPLVSNGAPNVLGRDASTCFPDLMPLLVGNAASLSELNTRLPNAIDVRRFRPNILVKGDGAAPWDEDRWKTLRITPKGKHGGGPMVFDITQRCARCRVPNVDPETAEEDKRQPWDTLMKYRRVDEGIKFKPCFGMLCVPRDGVVGKVKVGDRVEVVEVTDKHRYISGM
ncbi:MOSC-domain-containing protein [Phaeosphaeriaceae sp. SRC1lsM3a]|nr:MOSC-domain-containing protein [Stagonospora sp. SRC1lsM3a]